MILNLLRVQELRVQDMMRRSFSEFASQTDLPQQRLLAKQARACAKLKRRGGVGNGRLTKLSSMLHTPSEPNRRPARH